MNIKSGDNLLIDGKQYTVNTYWNQMKDRVFIMTDGTEFRNLDRRLTEGTIEKIIKRDSGFKHPSKSEPIYGEDNED